MNKAEIESLIQNINKINLENRKKPEIALNLSRSQIDNFIVKSRSTREELIEDIENRLDNNANQSYLIILVEMLKQYV